MGGSTYEHGLLAQLSGSQDGHISILNDAYRDTLPTRVHSFTKDYANVR